MAKFDGRSVPAGVPAAGTGGTLSAKAGLDLPKATRRPEDAALARKVRLLGEGPEFEFMGGEGSGRSVGYGWGICNATSVRSMAFSP